MDPPAGVKRNQAHGTYKQNVFCIVLYFCGHVFMCLWPPETPPRHRSHCGDSRSPCCLVRQTRYHIPFFGSKRIFAGSKAAAVYHIPGPGRTPLGASVGIGWLLITSFTGTGLAHTNPARYRWPRWPCAHNIHIKPVFTLHLVELRTKGPYIRVPFECHISLQSSIPLLFLTR